MARIVVLGSSNTDMTVRLPQLPAPGETRLGGAFATSAGGKGANQAMAARRAGAEVIFLTAVGDDTLGRKTLEHYERQGLDVRWARIVPGVSSGVALIFVGEGGENMIGVAPGANDHLSPDDIERLPDSLFTPGSLFLASLEVPFAAVIRGLRRARARGMTTMVNPAPIHPAILDPEVLALIDVLTPNRAEALALARDLAQGGPRATSTGRAVSAVVEAARLIRMRGVARVAVTLGSEGCLVATEEGYQLLPAPEVVAVDTVGAGDAFNGALAVALSEGRPMAEASAWACAAGALAVTRPGAQGATTHRVEIDRLAALAPPPRALAEAEADA
jgi:ribokinase